MKRHIVYLWKILGRGRLLAALAGAVLSAATVVAQQSVSSPDPASAPWQEMFDGKSLAGWAQSGFEGEGGVRAVGSFYGGRGAIVVERGTTLSGVTWARSGMLPRVNYELALEAMRVEGADFFCGLTFPVGRGNCTLVVGGWGGTVVGLSNIDRADASANETTRHMEFADMRWYAIRLRVSETRIEAWIDEQKVVDLATSGRVFSLRPGDIQKSLPLGISTFMTTAAIRGIRLRRLPAAAPKAGL